MGSVRGEEITDAERALLATRITEEMSPCAHQELQEADHYHNLMKLLAREAGRDKAHAIILSAKSGKLAYLFARTFSRLAKKKVSELAHVVITAEIPFWKYRFLLEHPGLEEGLREKLYLGIIEGDDPWSAYYTARFVSGTTNEQKAMLAERVQASRDGRCAYHYGKHISGIAQEQRKKLLAIR